MDVRLVDLPPVTAAALLLTPPRAGNIVMTNVYIDGTSCATKGLDQAGPASSGLCIIHELDDGGFSFGGFSGMLVDLDPLGPYHLGADKSTNGVA